MKIFRQKLSVLAIILALFIFPIFGGVADFGPNKNILIVNSQNFEDVISGSVYATQNNYLYTFILTESHGQYWLGLLQNTNDNIKYYQSSDPVHSSMADQLSAFSNTNIEIQTSDDLSALFSQMQDSNFAVIVGNEIGAEALSAAPYAIAQGSAFYFADDTSADALTSTLLQSHDEVLVYGSIANSLSIEVLDSVQTVNSGSIYLDNAQLLDMYLQIQTPSQVLFSSGKTFEPTILNSQYPIALVGRTEAAEGLFYWIAESGVKSGIIYSGDADISGSIDSIKKQTGLPIFAKLGQGFVGDSKMQPLAVMQIPSKDVLLEIQSVYYQNSAFEVVILNEGQTNAYVRAAASVGDGRLGSGQMEIIGPGESKKLHIPLEGVSAFGVVPSATFQIYSGWDPKVVESIDVVTFSDIHAESDSSNKSATNSSIYTPLHVEEGGNSSFLIAVSLILILLVAYLLMHAAKPGSHAVLGRGSYKAKKGSKKRRRK